MNRIIPKKETPMLCSLSNLKENTIHEIQALENDLGITVLAYSCHKTEPAIIDANKLKKIQTLEKNLGLSLIAINTH